MFLQAWSTTVLSVYFLPFYQAVFGDKFRFLHVLRDGRDVAYGDNQMQFWMLCERFYGKASGFCDREKMNHHVASIQVKTGPFFFFLFA